MTPQQVRKLRSGGLTRPPAAAEPGGAGNVSQATTGGGALDSRPGLGGRPRLAAGIPPAAPQLFTANMGGQRGRRLGLGMASVHGAQDGGPTRRRALGVAAGRKHTQARGTAWGGRPSARRRPSWPWGLQTGRNGTVLFTPTKSGRGTSTTVPVPGHGLGRVPNVVPPPASPPCSAGTASEAQKNPEPPRSPTENTASRDPSRRGRETPNPYGG